MALALVAVGLAVAGTGPGPDGPDTGPATGPGVGPDARVVAVAARDLDAGTVLGPDDVTWRALPERAVPPTAVAQDEAVNGRTVTAPIDGGEVVSRRRLAPDGARGAAALVPVGAVALAVARDEATPDLEAGQRIDVLTTAVIDPTSAPGLPPDDLGSGARRVAADALVVSVTDERVLVAVADDEAPALAAALLDGAVVLALVGAGG